MQLFELFFTVFAVFIARDLSHAYPLYDDCSILCATTKLDVPQHIGNEGEVCDKGCSYYPLDPCNSEIKMHPADTEMILYNCKFKCGIACLRGFASIEESAVCTQGCQLIGGLHMDIVNDILDYAKEDDRVQASPEKDVDVEMLSDPSIKKQLNQDGDYKIPETHITTMPINKTKEDNDTGDWLECASRNSGIPRWILLIAILSAVLVAVWLCFAVDKKNVKDKELDKKPILYDDIVKEPAILDDSPMIISDYIDFIPPPPYKIENENEIAVKEL